MNDKERKMFSTDQGRVALPTTSGEAWDRAVPIRALVVDDDHSSVVIVSRWLEKLGIRADAANGCLAAQQCIKQSRYDVVVTDLQMPILGGYELAAWIKHESERIPVIMMTGCSFLEIEEKLNAGRVDAWLF
ncbi:MAG: response regulator, partial [Desulfosarcinaceae bacterium]